jgi:hypothetical protein
MSSRRMARTDSCSALWPRPSPGGCRRSCGVDLQQADGEDTSAGIDELSSGMFEVQLDSHIDGRDLESLDKVFISAFPTDDGAIAHGRPST